MRHPSRSRALVPLLAVMALLVAATTPGCGDDRGGAGGGGTGAATPSDTFGQGPCWQCAAPACEESLATCKADAGCAAWVACLEACPLAANGNADPACEAECPVDGTVASQGRDGVVACRNGGPGAACTACGVTTTASTGTGVAACELPPALDQTCGPSGAEGCNGCVFDNCCDLARDALLNDGPTKDLVDCWLACPSDDGDCSYQCYLDHPDGVSGFGSFRACNEIKCEVPGLCPSPHETECLLCQRASCECELANCYVDTGCHSSQECLLSCAPNDTACGEACKNAYPEGAAKFELLATCTAQNCVDVCL